MLGLTGLDQMRAIQAPLSISILPSDSITEKANRAINHFGEIDSIIENLLSDTSNGSTNCIKFLKSLLEQYDRDPAAVAQCAYYTMFKVPLSTIIKLLEESPLVFVQLMKCLNAQDMQSRQIDGMRSRDLLKYITGHVNNWKSLFQYVFHSLDKSLTRPNCSPQETEAGGFLLLLLTSLSNRRCRQWIKHCAIQLPEEDWPFFILALSQKPRIFALNVFTRFQGLYLTEEGLLPWIEALVQQMDYLHLIRPILNHILHKFYRRGEFGEVVNQFKQLTTHAQVCFLDAMTPAKQDLVFEKYHGDLSLMASWMDGLFHYRPNFLLRKCHIQKICDCLENQELLDLLSLLASRKSQVGPYLLVCLSRTRLKTLVDFTPYELLSELLYNGMADSAKGELLQAIGRLAHRSYIYKSMFINMDNSIVPVDPTHPLTLKEAFEIMQQVAASKELAANYATFITRLPPVLVGFLALRAENRQTLLELAHFLTEEQCKFLITPFSIEEACQAIERIWTSLHPEQFMAILEALSDDQLNFYVKIKAGQLQQYYQQFLDHDKILQAALEAAEQLTQLTHSIYLGLEEQATLLFNLTRRPTLADYHYLLLYLKRSQGLERIPQEVLTTLNQTITHLNSKRSLFEGPHAEIRIRLSALEESIVDRDMQEEDLTSILYSGFWTLVQMRTWPYLEIGENGKLGIADASQLNLLGIKSNRDLDYLGISPEAQKRVGCLIQEVEKLAGHNLEEKKEEEKPFKVLWQTFIDISDDKPKPTYKKLIEALHLELKDFHQIKACCLRLCQELLAFVHISEEDKEALMKSQKLVEASQTLEGANQSLLSFLAEELRVLKSQYPLFCLQRYLLCNRNLKQTWERLRSLNCHSIDDLVKRGFIQKAADFLKLEEIVAEQEAK
jgi:hypothetical protein